MRVVVAGAAGLIGSHLTEQLIRRGDQVVAVDDLSTGRLENLQGVWSHPRFEFVHADVAEDLPVRGAVDAVCHLASPASPSDFPRIPRHILRCGSLGTFRTIDLAAQHGATYLLASTSEVYGDPTVHPQHESYLGNVSCTGPRACYDESKRFSEAIVTTYRRSFDVDTRIARIFNTYGPRLRPDDGRVVSNFVVQMLRGVPITIHGDGRQTRSFCFVDDQVRGLLALLDSDEHEPVNIGNPVEVTMCELAELVCELGGRTIPLRYLPMPVDDPVQRRPDIARARELLRWQPEVSLREGLQRTIDDLRRRLAADEDGTRPASGRTVRRRPAAAPLA